MFSWSDPENARPRLLAFLSPLTESTSKSQAIFFCWGYIHALITSSQAGAQMSHRRSLPLPHLLASHLSRQAPAIYNHYLKVMMRVNKFHAAGTNCPAVSEKAAAVITAVLGACCWWLRPCTPVMTKWPLHANVHHLNSSCMSSLLTIVYFFA